MSITAVSITKSCSFRGVAQEFSNTYHYNTPLPVSAGTAEGLIDQVKALEVPMHSSAVSFVRGRAWSAGGTPGQNQMLFQKPLTGAGTGGGAMANQDRERAFLVRFRAGIDSKGRPVYLRKWWHLLLGSLNSVTIAAGVLENTTQLQASQRTQLETWANAFKSLTVGVQNFDLVSDKGRAITGATEAHPFLEHHQLGDMWRS